DLLLLVKGTALFLPIPKNCMKKSTLCVHASANLNVPFKQLEGPIKDSTQLLRKKQRQTMQRIPIPPQVQNLPLRITIVLLQMCLLLQARISLLQIRLRIKMKRALLILLVCKTNFFCRTTILIKMLSGTLTF
ncbi:hypothetical protein H0H93_009903, partial [Arthromyces matolae]